MFNGTPETEKLCREIAEINEGVCVLGFSGGKDALAAWLYLRNFFDKIIPFHCHIMPGLGFIERSLKYYEEFFETPIERYALWEGLPQYIQRGSFQDLSGAKFISNNFTGKHWTYFNHDTAYLVAEKHGIGDTWRALGYSLYDSLDRIGWVRACQGKHEKYGTFYPCWNWKTSEILEYIAQHKVSLGEDYLLTGRSFCDFLEFGSMTRMKEIYPEDFDTVKSWFPLIEAVLARHEFRAMKEKKHVES